MAQQVDRAPHVPTATELRRAERESWFRIPLHDDKPSSRLSISLSGVHEHRQSCWNDTENQSLNDRLNQILQEAELRAAAMERDRLQREEEARLKRRRWEAAIDQAKNRLIDHHRGEELQRQVVRWQEADAIRRYCQALEQQTGDHERGMGEWIEWARRYADRVDPLLNPPGMPADPDAAPDALRPSWDAAGAPTAPMVGGEVADQAIETSGGRLRAQRLVRRSSIRVWITCSSSTATACVVMAGTSWGSHPAEVTGVLVCRENLGQLN